MPTGQPWQPFVGQLPQRLPEARSPTPNMGQLPHSFVGQLLQRAALFDEITLKDGRVQQSNFHDYPTMRLSVIPPIEVAMIESDDDPGGVG